MLQSMRSGAQSTPAKVLVILIVLSFAGFGIESVLFGGSGTSVADVNGTEITPQALQAAIDNQKRQLMQIFGDDIDPMLLDDDRLRPRALDQLIEQELLLQEAQNRGMVASDRAIGRVVASVDAFKVDGRFDPEQFKVVLANAGYTPERFRRTQGQDIMLTHLQQAVAETDFVTSVEMTAAADVATEERDVRYLIVPAGHFNSVIDVDDAAVRAFYEDNLDRFQSEPQVVAEYIALSAEDFIKPVDEAQLREQFDTVKDEYTVSEQARVSHILLIQGDDESNDSYAQRIDDVAARLAAGEDFAALAETLSDDVGSASLGGELGFTDGTAFPDAMEAAIAELEVGQISAAVETDAGVHYIRVEERIAGETPDFESLRAELADAIQRSEAEQELLVVVDNLRDLSFNSADLAGPAKALGVESLRSAPLSRAGGEGVFAREPVLEALFSDEVFDGGNNSEVIELPGSRFVAVRVAEKIPPRQLGFDEVADEVRASLEAEAQEEARAALLASVTERLAAGETLEAIANELGWEWRVELNARRQGSLLPAEVVQSAFALKLAEGATLDLVALPGDEYALVELARVRAGGVENLSEPERVAMSETLAEIQGQVSLLEYRTALRNNAEIVTR